MSGLAKSYQKAIRKELVAHGAWLPIANTFKIGDFGFFEAGVFRKIGNIKDKYPDITLTVASGKPASINFTSEGTRTFKFDADGKATTNFASLGNAQATLKFEFSKSNSVVIKVDQIDVEQLQNIEEVAMALVKKDSWRKRYKVVSAAYTGKNCFIVCSREAESEFAITANADVLREIEVGKASGGFEITASNSSTYDSVGDTGIIALKLFKLNWLNRLKLLKSPKITKEQIIIEDDFGKDTGELEDDF